MGFLERETTKSSNPTKRFLEWKAVETDDVASGKFAYYDKEQEKNVAVDSLTFLVLEEYATIKGWSEAHKSGIYSNEVLRLGESELNVRTFDGSTVAKGYYKDIKDKVRAAGGKFCRSVYIVTSDYELYNLQLKGTALKAWMDFTDKKFNQLGNTWITLEEAVSDKKGAVRFKSPNFKFTTEVTKEQIEKIKPVAKTFQDYMNGYASNAPEAPAETEVGVEDDVPF